MTNPFLVFCAGFVAGAVPFLAFIVIYYVRARRRVESIKAAILKHQQATRSVGEAANKVYGKTQRHDL